MTVRRLSPLLIFTGLVLALSIYTPSGASDGNRVAVVVDYGNGQIVSRCVAFTEDAISGYEALERTGLPVETDFQTGGAAICRIDGQGCPSEDCFCSCRGGGECKYWSYWHLNDGVWNYSSAGAGIYQVRDGAVEGWVWGLGSVTQAIPPPLITFNEVCTINNENTPTSTSSPTHTATPIILPTGVPTAENLVSTPTTNPSVSITPAPTIQSSPVTVNAGVTIAATIPSIPGTPETVLPPQATLDGGQDAQPQLISGQEEGVFTPNTTPTQTNRSTATPEMTETERLEGLPFSDSLASESEISDLIVTENQTVEGDIVNGEPVTHNSVSGTVGQGVSVDIEPQILSVQEEEVDKGLSSYWGFAGLILLLCALTLFVYRRQVGSRAEVNR